MESNESPEIVASKFDHDRPVSHAAEDLLNRSPFAARLTKVLSDLPHGSSMIIGIHGPWGDGKSTVLNFIRENAKGEKSLIIRDFNPWRISEDDVMFRGFFSVLADGINASLSTSTERTLEKGSKLAKVFRWITRPAAIFSKTAESVDSILEKYVDAVQMGNSTDLEVLRKRLVRHLEKSETKLVILIDDIDRLDNHETHRLFRLIKACADFPNVCHVLAFDDVVVSKTLGDQYGGDEVSGRAFLEKIIQLPLKLPVALKADLRHICNKQIENALAASNIVLTDNEVGELVSALDSGVIVRIATPREAKRFGNGLLFALPMLKDEISVPDLVLIEAVRAFYPQTYDLIRSNLNEFAGVDDRATGGRTSRIKPSLDSQFEQMSTEHAEGLKELLFFLFPKLNGLYGRGGYGNEWLASWSKKRRICSPQYSDRYFTYSIDKNDVSGSDIALLLRLAVEDNESGVMRWLSGNMHGIKSRRVLEQLRLVEDTLDATSAILISVCVARLGDLLPNVVSLFGFSEPPGQAAILISKLLMRVEDGNTRVNAGIRVLREATPLWFAAECLRWFKVTDDPQKESRNTYTPQQFIEVQAVVIERIKASAAEGAPLFDPQNVNEASLLYVWWTAEGRDPVMSHLLGVFARTPELIMAFLRSQAPQAWSAGSVLPHYSSFDVGNLKNINLVIDIDVLADLVIKNCKGDFINPGDHHDDWVPVDVQIAEKFIYAYRAWKAA